MKSVLLAISFFLALHSNAQETSVDTPRIVDQTTILVTTNDSKQLFLRIVDARGRLVFEHTATANVGVNRLRFDLDTCRIGCYYIVVSDEKGVLGYTSFVKAM
jgi:hypothetical protein